MQRHSKIRKATVYPINAIEQHARLCDVIDIKSIQSIPDLFQQRVRRSPDKVAYQQYDHASEKWQNYSWKQMSDAVQHWQRALAHEHLLPQDRVAIRLKNSCDWVTFDQAALAQGLVVVPIYVEDRADNIAYILEHTESKLFLLDNYRQYLEMQTELDQCKKLTKIVIVHVEKAALSQCDDSKVVSLSQWLAAAMPALPQSHEIQKGDLATIVYTSGTTGKPKGVMLSHENMYSNAYAGLKSVAVYPTDRALSFLPLSHMFERTVGYYFNIFSGCRVAFNRSIPELLDDLAQIKPTIMISVPRIFERAYVKISEQLEAGPVIKKYLFDLTVNVGWRVFQRKQGECGWRPIHFLWPVLNILVASKIRQKFGGHLRFAVSGGARLEPKIAKVFIGVGIDILQGYGLTESGPVLTVNTLSKNRPSSIGLPLHGAQLQLGEGDELQAKGAGVMMGYWKDPKATAGAINQKGWLLTGDLAHISEQGFISIIGRIKEIIMLTNGEKIPPADMETAICDDTLFEHAMVIGEGKPYLTAVISLNKTNWHVVIKQLSLDVEDQQTLTNEKAIEFVLHKISTKLAEFPGYAFIRNVVLTMDEWGVENGFLTPTLKLKRNKVHEQYQQQITQLYPENF